MNRRMKRRRRRRKSVRKGIGPLYTCRGEGRIRNDEGKKRRLVDDSIRGGIGTIAGAITHVVIMITR